MGEKGYLMQLQPFSVNDGDGIRTTIFLAGCPLRCRWCSNPEGFAQKPLVGWYSRRCIGCGACAQVCPQGIGVNLNRARAQCTACGRCVAVCPGRARVQLVHLADVGEVVRQLHRHAVFYRFSRGGISFSGGECTAQPAFFNDLTQRIYDLGYSMDMETCGHFSFEEVRPSLERMDLIFMDLKLMDDEKHKLYTGVSNRQTLQNLRRLNEVSAEVVVRIPTIGGVNSDVENIRRSAAYVHAALPKARMELLPYHAFGTLKYEALGIPYAHGAFYRPDADEMERLKAVIRAQGVALADFR